MTFEELFPWESETQKKSLGALLKWTKDTVPNGIMDPVDFPSVPVLACFFFQKDHETHLWWQEQFSNYSSSVETLIESISSENESMKREISELKAQVEKLLGRHY